MVRTILSYYVNLSHALTFVAARVEKYRPVTLDDVVSHKEITGTSTHSIPLDPPYYVLN